MEFGWSFEILLFASAFLAGIIDAIAGGGGLIVLPILFLSGLSPSEALGTNKLQALFGSGSATLRYAQKGLLSIKDHKANFVLCLLLSFLGALCVSLLPRDMILQILPFILILIALYFGFKPNLSDADRNARLSRRNYGLFIAPFIAYYDGLIGPGAGTFYMLGWITLAGLGIIEATAHAKLQNFASNIGAFLYFAIIGSVHWKLGLLMGLFQFLGARVGASLAIHQGAKLIRPLVVISSIALALKLLLS